jgi:hypothetical protein
MGLTIPIAHLFLNDPAVLQDVGLEGTRGLVHLSQYGTASPFFKTPEQIRYYRAWNHLWRSKWKTPPYDSRTYEHGLWAWTDPTYWLLSVIERAGSTDPEKIIAVWEGDSYRYVTGKVVRMRPCDHKAIQDLAVSEYVEPARQRESFNIPPYHWFGTTSAPGPMLAIPARHILPLMDEKLERCKGKSPAAD